MFYVYLIQLINFPNQRYIGHTDNLEEHLLTHESGGLIYTKAYRLWKLIYFCGFQDKLKVTAFEKYLKLVSGRAFANKRFW